MANETPLETDSIFSALESLKCFRVGRSAQLVDTGNGPELSARSSGLINGLYSGLWKPNEVGFGMFNMMEKDVYGNQLKVRPRMGVFQFPEGIISAMKTDYSKFDTSLFWNYLHSEWKYCDVITHANGGSLEAYRKIKTPLYQAFIDKHLIPKRKDWKRTLEIGPGYGLFPKLARTVGIKTEYWCLDVVKRFEHDNFVIGNGMEFPECVDGKFDLVFMLDAYSHIPSEAMENYLRAVLGMLSDDGMIMLNTPHTDGCCVFFGTVTRPLPFDRMCEIADSAGFAVEVERLFLTSTFAESDIRTIKRKESVDNLSGRVLY